MTKHKFLLVPSEPKKTERMKNFMLSKCQIVGLRYECLTANCLQILQFLNTEIFVRSVFFGSPSS